MKIRAVIVAALLASATFASGDPEVRESRAVTDRARRQVERVMNSGLPFAEQALAEFGEFAPFGAVMLPDGLIQNLTPDDGVERPSAAQIHAKLSHGLREGARRGKYLVAATFVLVQLPHPETGEAFTALRVGLEHRDGYCVDVFYPTVREGDRVVLREAFAGRRSGIFFDDCN
jgi:hypothetical protein